MFGNIGGAIRFSPGSQLTGGPSPNGTGTNMQASSNPAGGLFGLLGARQQGSGGAALNFGNIGSMFGGGASGGAPGTGFTGLFGGGVSGGGAVAGNPWNMPASPHGPVQAPPGVAWTPGQGTAPPQGPAREWWWDQRGANTPLPGTPGGVGYQPPGAHGFTPTPQNLPQQPQNPFQNMHPGMMGIIQQIMAQRGGMGNMRGIAQPRLGIQMPQQAPRMGWSPLPSMNPQAMY